MGDKLMEEFEGKRLKQETSPKLTGSIFLLLAILVLAIGILVHYVQFAGLPDDAVVEVLVARLDMKFASDFFVGFFTGIFTVVGIYCLRQKPKETQ